MIKKILLFLVEGLSDKEALEPILSELLDNTRIYFEVLRCDLSSNDSTEMRDVNMKNRLTKVVKKFLDNNHGINKMHIEKIIFLSDTDGCYVDGKDIKFSEADNCFRYEDDGIYTNRPEAAKNRNKRKASNLNMIHSTQKIFALPIETYYFSCNLDHVLHEERNLEQYLKEDYAFEFADRYENKEAEFISFISEQSLCLAFDYVASWEKIKEENNSLLRYSNLIVFFYNNIECLKEVVRASVTLCQE